MQEIKELSMAVAGIDLQLALTEVQKLKGNLSLELQAVRDDRRAQHREFQEFMGDLRHTLDQIQAKHLLEASLLSLTGGNKDGGGQKEEENSGGNSDGASLNTAFLSHLRRRGLCQNSSSQSL